MRIRTKNGSIHEIDRVKKTQTYIDGNLYANGFFFYRNEVCVAKKVFVEKDLDNYEEMFVMEDDLFHTGTTKVEMTDLMN